MRFFSYDPPSGNGLIRLLRSYGLGGAIEEGLSTPHLAFIVRRLVRCQLKVYLHPESLRELGGQWSRCPLSLHRPIKPLKDINPIWAKGLNRAIQELRSDGVLVTVGSYGLQSVTSGLTESALIVKVDCARYYQLHLPAYDEAHFLALVNVKNTLVVCDSYELRGYQELPRWRRHLAQASKFGWAQWRGDVIVISGIAPSHSHPGD